MTTVNKPPDAPGQIAEPATHEASTLLERLADRLAGQASVRTVYGEPISTEGVTVIPVAKVRFGFGGGAGREVGAERSGGGGGGGGGAEARPLGFIEIKEGAATFTPIREPWTESVLPSVAIAAGSVVPRLARAIRSRRRR